MTRNEFLGQLRGGLAGLRPQDLTDIIADYDAHFDEGLAHGRTEADIAQSLGDPKRLARELRAEAQVRAWEQKPTPANFFAVLFAFIGLAALDFVVMIPLLGWLALFTFITIVVCIALVIGGIVALLSVVEIHQFPNLQTGIARFFTGLGLIGFGAGLGASLLMFCRWVIELLTKFARLHYKLLKQADEATR